MNKYSSKKNVLIVVIILCTSLTNSFISTKTVQSRQSTDLTGNLVRYLGLYVFNYPKCNPPQFEKFRWISVDELPNQNIDKPETDAKGYTQIGGYVETIDDEQFKFKKATLKKNSSGNYEDFEFETEKINGIHYTFKGNFLKKSVNEGGIYTDMKGTLSRYKNGELIASLEMAPFSKYANM